MANHILLLGAGFSRNWGGFLTSDVGDKLMARPELYDDLRTLLRDAKQHRGNFETVLGQLQAEAIRSGGVTLSLSKFQQALRAVFEKMDEAFAKVPFEFHQSKEYLIASFLLRFDAIFTLNQDTLLERWYLNDNICLLDERHRWGGWDFPGMSRDIGRSPAGAPSLARWVPATGPITVAPRMQPIIKLHGGITWYAGNSDEMMVMGTGKREIISRFPVLERYLELFGEYLKRPDTRLMTIGYGFADLHVNEAIIEAAKSHDFQLWIVGPSGDDVLNREAAGATIPYRSALSQALGPSVRGQSRRDLRAIFGGDVVEHGALMEFFSTP